MDDFCIGRWQSMGEVLAFQRSPSELRRGCRLKCRKFLPHGLRLLRLRTDYMWLVFVQGAGINRTVRLACTSITAICAGRTVWIGRCGHGGASCGCADTCIAPPSMVCESLRLRCEVGVVLGNGFLVCWDNGGREDDESTEVLASRGGKSALLPVTGWLDEVGKFLLGKAGPGRGCEELLVAPGNLRFWHHSSPM